MKVLITGANGFLGKKIAKTFSEKGEQVILTDKSRQDGSIFLDVTDKTLVLQILEKFRPDAVIHTAAITRVDWCESHRKETFDVNVSGTKNIAIACRKINAKMVLISTDYVFDGTKKGKYTEKDTPNPVNAYAESKLEAERIVQKELKDYLILRVTVLYGFNDKSDKKCFPVQVIETLSQKKEFFCFAEQYSNPTLINDIADAILYLLRQNIKGIFNSTGSENLGRMEFAEKIAQVFGLDQNLLRRSSWESSGFIAKRPPHLDISIEKLEKTGVKMSNAQSGLLKMKQDMQTVKI